MYMRRNTTVLCCGRLTNEMNEFQSLLEKMREKRIERLRVVWKDPTHYVTNSSKLV